MPNNISVSITADVADLVAKRAILSAELKAATKDLNDFAKTARTSGMTDELRAGMLAAASATTTTRNAIAAIDKELVGHAGHVGSTRQAYEGLRITQALLTGDFVRAGEESVRLAEHMTAHAGAANILSLAMNPVILSAAALTAALGYLIVQEQEQIKASQATAEAFALTGRAASNSAEAVRAEVDQLSSLPGVTRKAAEELVNFDATHADVSVRISNAANQLLPAYVKAFGKDAPEAVNKLKEALAGIAGAPLNEAIQKFDELNRTQLNLAPAEAAVVEKMIEAGDATGAMVRVIQDLGARGGAQIQSFAEQIRETQIQLQQAQRDLQAFETLNQTAWDPNRPEGYAEEVAAAAVQVGLLTDRLHALKNDAATEAFNDDVRKSDRILDGLKDSATRAKDAVADLHRIMAERRNANPLDPKVIDYYANQARRDRDYARQVDPGDFKTPRRRGEKSMGTEWTDELRAQELAAVQAGQGSSAQLLAIEEKFWADKVAHARQGTQNYKEALGHLEQTQLEEAKQAAAQRREIAVDDIQAQLTIEKSGIAQRKAAIEAAYEAEKDTATDAAEKKRDALKALADEEARDEIDALEARKAQYAEDPVELNRIANQEREIWANLAAEKANIDRQYTQEHLQQMEKQARDAKEAAEKQARAWRTANQEVLGAEQQLISGILSGRQSLGKLLGQIALQMVEREIAADIQYWTERKLLAAEGIAAEQAKEQGGVLIHVLQQHQKVAAVVASQAAQTGATTAGVAVRTSAEITGATTAHAVRQAFDEKQIVHDAVKAATGAYQALVGIPVIGPIIAPPAAAAAFAAVLAFENLAGFERGVDVVPNDMIAQIHAGERVIPRADNSRLIEAMDAMAGRGFGGRSDGGGGQTHHYGPVHIHAIDSASVERWMRRNGQSLQKIIGERVRQNGAVAMGFAR